MNSCGTILLFALVWAAPARAVCSVLRGEVVDATTGTPVASRIYLQERESQRWHHVRSAAPEGSAVPYQKRNWVNTNAVEVHTTVSPHPFVADIPPGRYRLTVERGKEFFPSTQDVEAGTDQRTIRVGLQRWVDMASRGWYSGETHVHRPLDELRNVAAAEDLNVSFPLSDWVTRAFTAPARTPLPPAKAELVQIDKQHVIWPLNTEYEIFSVGSKSHTLGALFILNHEQPWQAGVPPWGSIAARARQQGAFLDMDKLDWPFAFSLPVSARADVYELANNHVWRTEFGFTKWVSAAAPYLQPPFGGAQGNERDWIHYTLGMYYTLLNAGFDLIPSAGTANGVHPVPAGFSRVYVHLPGGFSYDAWLEAWRKGRSFVTTGPMLFATINGKDPGEIFNSAPSENYAVAGEVLSEQPLAFLEVIENGIPARTVMPQNRRTADGAYTSAFKLNLPVKGSAWVALRGWEDGPGGRVRFAHTAPWHMRASDQPLQVRQEEKAYLLGRMKTEIERSRPVLPPAAIQEYEAALAHYEKLPVRADPAESAEGRPPRGDAELHFWLENMIVHHRFTGDEVRRATSLSDAAIAEACQRLEIAPEKPRRRSPDEPLLVLPYPGGRHPRTGFLEGAIHPQRDTKISVFTPWDPASYVVVDVPEAIFANLGLIYLAHTHVPTIWEQQGMPLPKVEWVRKSNGALEFERLLPNRIAFGARVVPRTNRVEMELWLRNGTDQTLTQMRVQNCVMLKAALGFHAQTSQNKVIQEPYVAVRSEAGARWIITAWEPLHRAWANPPVPCLHSDPKIPDCAPGETQRLKGWLWFYEGEDLDAELQRADRSFRKLDV